MLSEKIHLMEMNVLHEALLGLGCCKARLPYKGDK